MSFKRECSTVIQAAEQLSKVNTGKEPLVWQWDTVGDCDKPRFGGMTGQRLSEAGGENRT